MKSNLQLAREFVCWNQGEIAQFYHIASILHRNLKDEFHSADCCKETIEYSVKNLLEYLNRNLRRISRENFSFLQEYFQNRSKTKPRVCIKVNYQNRIVELFREKQVPYYTDYETESNTGFYQVKKTGKYFLCNNIPQDYISEKYHNPRLKPISESQYTQSFVKSILHHQKMSPKKNWLSCWQGDTAECPTSCYSSTLIIPMTLANNKLSTEYQYLINIEKDARTIFGFLCIDHVTVDYFNESSDIDMGYIIADLLSLFLINRLNYTDSSSTFLNSLKYLNKPKS